MVGEGPISRTVTGLTVEGSYVTMTESVCWRNRALATTVSAPRSTLVNTARLYNITTNIGLTSGACSHDKVVKVVVVVV